MEDMIMAYSSKFKVTTARFANVAFSNGSLPDGWMQRVMKKQPLAAPNDVKRYFVSPEESGQICMLACILGKNGEIFFPKLGEKQMLTFSSVCDEYIRAIGYVKKNSPQMRKRSCSHQIWLSIIKVIRWFISVVTRQVRKHMRNSIYSEKK